MAATELNRKKATAKAATARKAAKAQRQQPRLSRLPEPERFEAGDVAAIMAGEVYDEVRELADDEPQEHVSSKRRSVDTSAERVAVINIPLEKLHRHPANPLPAENDVLEQAAWMKAAGQIEPLIVRPLRETDDDAPIGHFEILSGERRYRAAELLRWPTIECRVREDLTHDDTEALLVMARSNEHRHKETPIRAALMIQAMIAAGIDKLVAGAVYGLESRSGIDNKLALLKLPVEWQQRLVSAEVPERVARALVPYAAYPRLMKAIEACYQKDQKQDWLAKEWQHGDDARERIDAIVDEHTRPIDEKVTHSYGYQLGWNHPRYFDLTPEIEMTLGVAELPLGDNGKLVKVATNCVAYDKLQVPLIKKKLKEKERTRSAGGKAEQKAAKGAKGKAKPPTAAELKRKQAEADKKTAARVDEWRHRFVRFLCSEALRQGDWRTGVLNRWLTANVHDRQALCGALHDAVMGMSNCNGRSRNWKGDVGRLDQVLAAIDTSDDELSDNLDIELLQTKWLLWPATNAGVAGYHIVAKHPDVERLPYISPGELEKIALLLEVDVAAGWKQAAILGSMGRAMVEKFFQLHTKEQLDDLVAATPAAPLGTKKSDMIKGVMDAHTRDKPLPLPKSIKPIAAAKGKAKPKRKAAARKK